MNKIYLVGDTHGTWNNLTKFNHALDNDIVIVLGDFGFIWEPSMMYIPALQRHFKEMNSLLLFVDGNHENFDVIETLPIISKWGGDVHYVDSNIYHLMRGQVYNIFGNSIFTMGGAVSIDKDRRAEFISWWKQENINHKEIETALDNLEKVNFTVDYVLTHTAPHSIVSELHGDHNSGFITDYNTKILEEFYSRITFKKWYFGHHHADQRLGRFTVLYKKSLELGE